VHHHRRPEADAEAGLVQHAAKELGCAFEIRHLESTAQATPADLRSARYDALCDIAVGVRSNTIALAHQAQDQLETVLAAIVRGTGPRGLVGMPEYRHLAGDVYLMRPMLEVDRAAAAELCTVAGLQWCDDPTNSDPTTLRGRLRRDVLPVLESLRPGVASRLAAATKLRLAAADALDRAVIAPTELSENAAMWARPSLAAIGIGLCQASLMATARTMAGGSDGLSSTTLLAASVAILDGRQHRRVFEFGCGVIAIVDAVRVRVQQLQADQPIESRPPK
jgi:tRNA(Ile)-lysidine synthase